MLIFVKVERKSFARLIHLHEVELANDKLVAVCPEKDDLEARFDETKQSRLCGYLISCAVKKDGQQRKCKVLQGHLHPPLCSSP